MLTIAFVSLAGWVSCTQQAWQGRVPRDMGDKLSDSLCSSSLGCHEVLWLPLLPQQVARLLFCWILRELVNA